MGTEGTDLTAGTDSKSDWSGRNKYQKIREQQGSRRVLSFPVGNRHFLQEAQESWEPAMRKKVIQN